MWAATQFSSIVDSGGGQYEGSFTSRGAGVFKVLPTFTGSAGRPPGGHSRDWLFIKNTTPASTPIVGPKGPTAATMQMEPAVSTTESSTRCRYVPGTANYSKYRQSTVSIDLLVHNTVGKGHARQGTVPGKGQFFIPG